MDFLDSRGDQLRVPFNLLSALFGCALLAVGIHAILTEAYRPCLGGLLDAACGRRPSPGGGLPYVGGLLLSAEFVAAFALGTLFCWIIRVDVVELPAEEWPVARTRVGRRIVAFLSWLDRFSSIAANGTGMLLGVTIEEVLFRLVPLLVVPRVLGVASAAWLAALFWASVVGFAAVHLRKFQGGFRRPYLCLPQFIAGIVHGYVFLAYGFVAVVAYHWIFNAALATWSDDWESYS